MRVGKHLDLRAARRMASRAVFRGLSRELQQHCIAPPPSRSFRAAFARLPSPRRGVADARDAAAAPGPQLPASPAASRQHARLHVSRALHAALQQHSSPTAPALPTPASGQLASTCSPPRGGAVDSSAPAAPRAPPSHQIPGCRPHLHVAGALDVALQQHAVVAKARQRLALGRVQRVLSAWGQGVLPRGRAVGGHRWVGWASHVAEVSASCKYTTAAECVRERTRRRQEVRKRSPSTALHQRPPPTRDLSGPLAMPLPPPPLPPHPSLVLAAQRPRPGRARTRNSPGPRAGSMPWPPPPPPRSSGHPSCRQNGVVRSAPGTLRAAWPASCPCRRRPSPP